MQSKTNEKAPNLEKTHPFVVVFSSAGVRYERFGAIVGDLPSVTDRAARSGSVGFNYGFGNKPKQIVQ